MGPRERRRALLRRAARAPRSTARSASCAFSRSAISRCSASFSSRQRARLAEQIDEDADLRPQDLRVDRLAQVVDARRRRSPRGRRRRRSECAVRNRIGMCCERFRCLISCRQLDAAHARHLDVEHDRREVVLAAARSSASSADVGAHERAIAVAEHRLERVEVARLVVDDQDLSVWRRGIIVRTSVIGTATRAAATAAGRC